MLAEKAILEFSMEQRGQFWNVVDIKSVAQALAEKTPTKPLSAPSPPTPEPVSPVNPQELGMWFKELGNRIGDGSIEKDWPKTAVKIKLQYYRKMAQITGITFMPEAQKKVSDEP